MKRQITKAEQDYINSLLKKRKEKQMTKVFSKSQDIERMLNFNCENKIARNGMTYLQIQELNHLS